MSGTERGISGALGLYAPCGACGSGDSPSAVHLMLGNGSATVMPSQRGGVSEIRGSVTLFSTCWHPVAMRKIVDQSSLYLFTGRFGTGRPDCQSGLPTGIILLFDLIITTHTI